MLSKRLVLLFSSALFFLCGCRSQQFHELTPDQQLAVDQAQTNSVLESDRAGVIFAQKTLELTQQQQGRSDASGAAFNPEAVEQANTDLYIAQTMLRLSQDREKLMTDYVRWRSFAKKLQTQQSTTDRQ